ncbi:hypothetical protein [Nocardioides sp. AE5]|uniref:hypothetical protein n=1 Tax=Nocardioides sp. AE5 TaxID=2962573 RepID=UPI002880C147|nr:hypothetical protein [Nocardioides sp. AE5]MDT0202234.1 hypothetical protein [Nocardioides sp. AE5]
MNTMVIEAAHLVAQASSESDTPWVLLLLGPAGAAGVYWMLFRFYRNIDKSHAFETETLIDAQPVTGQDHKVDEVRGTKRRSINGNNAGDHRTRVQRLH